MDILIRLHLPYVTSYTLGDPQLEQNFPLFFVPQEQIQSAEGLGEPQLEQNLQLFTVPQEQVQSVEGLGEPQFAQNLPLFTVPQEQVHPPVWGAAC